MEERKEKNINANEIDEKTMNEEGGNKKRKLNYSAYYSDIIVKEQPFYRKGMSEEEIKKEEDYLNNNIKDFYEGKYMPLWKQDWFK